MLKMILSIHNHHSFGHVKTAITIYRVYIDISVPLPLKVMLVLYKLLEDK